MDVNLIFNSKNNRKKEILVDSFYDLHRELRLLNEILNFKDLKVFVTDDVNSNKEFNCICYGFDNLMWCLHRILDFTDVDLHLITIKEL